MRRRWSTIIVLLEQYYIYTLRMKLLLPWIQEIPYYPCRMVLNTQESMLAKALIITILLLLLLLFCFFIIIISIIHRQGKE